jgi:hypothetical protein
MRRNFYLAALIALAALLSAGPSFAHGANQHASRGAPAAHSSPQPAAATASAKDASGPAIMAAASHQSPASECPAADGACCTNHCCTSGGLGTEPLNLTPLFMPAKAAVASDQPPAEATADGHLRPPCR